MNLIAGASSPAAATLHVALGAACRNGALTATLFVGLLGGIANATTQSTPGDVDADDPRTPPRQVAEPTHAGDTEASPLTALFDPHLSIEMGAEFTSAATTLLADLESHTLSSLKRRGRLGVVLRAARTALLDHPLALFLVAFQHEAFGHAGRAREFDADAGFRMGSPWTADVLFRGSTRFGAFATFDADALEGEEQGRVYAGGVESNGRAATLLERQLVAGQRMRPLELLYLVRSRSYASYYVLVSTPDPRKRPDAFFREWSRGGDVANYLAHLGTTHDGEARITARASPATVHVEYRRLRRHAWLNLLDPGMWLSAWGVAREIATGGEPAPLPLPRIAGRRVLPIVSADWLPDGGALSVETVFGRPRDGTSGTRWFSVTVRRGHGPAGGLWALGAATEKFAEWSVFRIGAEVELWRQPSYGTGAGAVLRFVATRNRSDGLLLDLGFKGDGHWPAHPASPGAFVRVGYRFAHALPVGR